MLKRITILILLGVVAILSACTHEDTDDCIQGVRLHFTYTLNTQNVNLFGAEVSAVTVLVFDKAGIYLNTYSSHGVPLTNDYVMNLPLKAGHYNFLVLGGDLSTYKYGEMLTSNTGDLSTILQVGKTSYKDLVFMINTNIPTSGPAIIDYDLGNLFHGILLDLNAPLGKITDATIDLMKDTKRINVNVIGLHFLDYITSQTKALDYASLLSIHATARNGQYKHDNSIDSLAFPLKHIFTTKTIVGDTLQTHTTMLRLMAAGDTSQLFVDIPERNLFHGNLVNMIMQNPKYKTQEDLDREHEFTFDIYLGSGNEITVNVNGWTVSHIKPRN